MTRGLLAGTSTGVYHLPALPTDDTPARVLDAGRVNCLRTAPASDTVLAATPTDAYRTRTGTEWTPLGVPVTSDHAVWSVLETSDGTLYAGTNEPRVFRSDDTGDSWEDLPGFHDIPSRSAWEAPGDPDRPRVRALASHTDHPDRILAGIESGGIHRTDDRGETWTDLRGTLEDDIHHILALGPDAYLAATGYLDVFLEPLGLGHGLGLGGLYRTRDAGASWTRLDADHNHAYIRYVFWHDGRLYYCGAINIPPVWTDEGADAVVFESDNLGRSFTQVGFPGAPREYIDAWAAYDDDVIAGASSYTPNTQSRRGRLLQRSADGTYRTVGRVPGRITGLAALST